MPASSKKEIRSNKSALSIRSGGKGRPNTIHAQAVVYNVLGQDLGGFQERFLPGAFTQSLKDNPDIRILFSHDPSKVLGRVSAGTATVRDTSTSLNFTCTLGKSSFAQDVGNMLFRGDVDQCSFGFRCVEDDWQLEGDILVRTVKQAEIFECSVVAFPVFPQTSAGLRSVTASCPPELRGYLTTRSEDDQDDDSEECDCDPEDDGCDCEEDRGDQDQDGDQDDCDCDPDQDDCDCDQNDQDAEDEQRSDQLRIRSLFNSKLKHQG